MLITFWVSRIRMSILNKKASIYFGFEGFLKLFSLPLNERDARTSLGKYLFILNNINGFRLFTTIT
jgi:hypothetical protein